MFIKTPVTQENCINTVQKIRSQNVQTFGYVYGTKSGPNRCPVWEIRSFFLIESCMSSFSKTIIGQTIQENSSRTRFGNSSKLGMLYRQTRKILFFSEYVDDIKLTGKKQNIDPMKKVLMKDLIWENRHHSLTLIIWVALKENAEISMDIVENYRTMFETKICAGATEKLPYSEKTWRKHFLMIVWYAKSCEEIRGTIWWTDKQNNSTILQSRNTMHWRPPIQGRRNVICRIIVKSLPTNCSKMHVFGAYW